MKPTTRRSILFLFGAMSSAIFSSNASASPKCAGDRFEIKKSGGAWYWTLYAANGEVVASHGGYNTRTECAAATQRLSGIARGAEISFKEDCE